MHTYLLYFKESLRGLSPGAQVDFHGIPLGEVRAVSFEYDRDAKTLRFPVQIDIYPERLRSRYRTGAPQMSAMERDPQVLLRRMVARGLRAAQERQPVDRAALRRARFLPGRAES